MNSPIFTDNNSFQTGSWEHLFTLLFFAVLGFVLVKWGKNSSPQKQHLIGNIIGFTLSFTVIVWTICRFYLGVFDIQEDLPLVFCNFFALMLPIFTLSRNRYLYYFLYFWVITLTVQAILTPHLYNSFPHYNFIKYWIVHCGLAIMISYATFVYGMRPRFKHILPVFFSIQPYILFCMALNYFIGANYMYLNHKPDTPSILDFLHSWPIYILEVELLALGFFFIAYLPFFIYDKFAARTLSSQ